jgi:hypothetical protein
MPFYPRSSSNLRLRPEAGFDESFESSHPCNNSQGSLGNNLPMQYPFTDQQTSENQLKHHQNMSSNNQNRMYPSRDCSSASSFSGEFNNQCYNHQYPHPCH